MDCFKVEKCSMVRQVQIWHSCWKSWTPCPLGYRGGRPSSVLSAFSSKASISDGMGVHKCIWYGQLACFGRQYECWKVYKGFRATHAPPQTTSIKGRSCVFQQVNAKPHTAAITTAWLLSRRVPVLNWPACSPDLSPIENICASLNEKYVNDDHKLSAAGNLSGKNGTKFQHQNSRNS